MIHQPARDLLAIWAEEGIPDDPSTRDYALTLVLELWEEVQQTDGALRELLDVMRPLCTEFRPDEGGAHPWCRVCGWRRDIHTEVGPLAQGVLFGGAVL